MQRLFCVLVLPTIAACAAARSREEAARALLEADRAFASATRNARLEGWTGSFAEDGAMIRPGGIARGHDAIRAEMAAALNDSSFTLEWDPHTADVGSSADLGYTIGRYTAQRLRADGQTATAHGTYVTVWKKQRDGSWKVAVDIGNPDP